MLEILDTAGVEEYTALQDEWIKDGEGFILVYNITSRGSFEHVQRLHHQVVKTKGSSSSSPSLWSWTPMMLVGNDCYRTAERVVSTQEGQALARQLGCDFLEASVNSGINVDKVFYDAVRDLRR
jgi:GTPase KRas protein